MNHQHSFLLVFPFLFAISVLYLMETKQEMGEDIDYAVNSVIGDQSYIHYYGEKPGKDVPDRVRIRTHLIYTEGVLRNRSTDQLSPEQKENRAAYLDFLREYYQEGEFPVNDSHADPRRPTFIDDSGNICAVGYMVEKSLGRDAAEAINEKHKHSFIYEIDDPAFKEWVKRSGFSIDELAMIQPSYEQMKSRKTNRNDVNLSYGVGSGFLIGANVFYLSNKSETSRIFTSSEANHWFGMAAGAGAVLLGVLNIDNTTTYYENPYYPSTPLCRGACEFPEVIETNHARTGLSIANLGVGLISVIRSGYHLLFNKADQYSATQISLDYLETERIHQGQPVPALQVQVNF